VTPEALTAAIKSQALELGFDVVGVAAADRVKDASLLAEWLSNGHHAGMGWMANHFEKRVDPRQLVPGCRSVLCVGLLYHQAGAGPQPEGVAVATYAWGEDYHRVLKDKLHALLAYGREIDATFDGRAFTDSAPVMDKYWAERAGLGWRGKNTNLINVKLGSFLFLGELLVEAELIPDTIGVDHCGTCTRCLEACPTGALVAPYVLDSARCIAYQTIEHRDELCAEEEEALGNWLFGCDVCQDVCPWNDGAPTAGEPRLEPRHEAWPTDLDAVVRMTEDDFVGRFGDSAIERTRRRGLARNAVIVAGNTGLGSTPALELATTDTDPVVAGTAKRVLARRRRQHIEADQPC
jgi:epoxyqueuosine reductase